MGGNERHQSTLTSASLGSQCCDLGFHTGLARTLQRYMGAERRARGGPLGRLEGLDGAVRGLDPSGDKAKVMEANPNAYCLPPSFEYQPHEGDEVRGSGNGGGGV